ncbi:AAA family ATPase [Nocardia sp. NPDC047038]|uniref:AAA family ATPase n=1 Tax=Nocardia sp. NPDC047038 TaxID=3154338 RepID=UPI00340CDCC6
MQLWVVSAAEVDPSDARDVVLLRETTWNDWWKYSTLYTVSYVDAAGSSKTLGVVKVGQQGMSPPEPGEPAARPALPSRSSAFDSSTFSLGQDPAYYENVSQLGSPQRVAIHKTLRDVAYDLTLCDAMLNEDVMTESLLREIPLQLLKGQFHRLAHGGARLTPYVFSFVSRDLEGKEQLNLSFEVKPESYPPTNIHAIVGRNGVGKSTLLNAMADDLAGRDGSSRGSFQSPNGRRFTDFNNLVSVSFSAFDDFEPDERNKDRHKFGYSYIGLKIQSVVDPFQPVPSQLDLLLEAVGSCLFEARKERWQNALRILEADPIFEQMGLVSLISSSANEVVGFVRETYPRLSSGHKIVLISITRLVATVEEKTLVLIDEPEAHLHPPLLSSYIRALSELMVDRNGVAIVATHSPVVLQEMPATCVWKLSLVGQASVAIRPDMETFGENVGVLTNEVFGLEVTSTGFHKMLSDVAEKYPEYPVALQQFNGQLGMEGRAILRARIAKNNRG